MSTGVELDRKIQHAFGEWSRLRAAGLPIKARLNGPQTPVWYVTDEEVKILLAPEEKFSEIYSLLGEKYPDLPEEE